MLTIFVESVVVGLALIFLVYPLVLSAANRWINGFWPSYGRTLATVIIAGIVASIVNYVITRIAGHGDIWLLRVVSVIVTLLVGGVAMNALVHRKDGAPLGYGRAALTCLVLGIVIVLISFGLSPWQKGLTRRLKAARQAQAPAAVSSAPAAGSSTPAIVHGTPAITATVPGAAASTPATGTGAPATASSSH